MLQSLEGTVQAAGFVADSLQLGAYPSPDIEPVLGRWRSSACGYPNPGNDVSPRVDMQTVPLNERSSFEGLFVVLHLVRFPPKYVPLGAVFIVILWKCLMGCAGWMMKMESSEVVEPFPSLPQVA